MRRLLSILLLALVSGLAAAQTDVDVVPDYLDSTVVAARRPGIDLSVLPGAESNIPIAVIKKLPSIMGLSDPVRFTFFLPSVQTGNDIDSGIHIQGCENAHNYVSMAGAPVYGAGHMLGLASVFNASHFEDMTYRTTASKFNRLGGVMSLSTPSHLVYKPKLNASLGFFLSQATVSIPAGRSSFFISARHSYFNLLYSKLMRYGGEPFRYDFGDYNATWLWKPGSEDTISLNAYFGRDAADFDSANWNADADVAWMNGLGSLSWKHDTGKWALNQILYGSISVLEDDIRLNVTREMAPSNIRTYGYKADFTAGGWEVMAETAAHFTLPMQPNDVEVLKQDALESALQAGYSLLRGRWRAAAWLRGTWYLSPERKSMFSLDPKLELSYATKGAGTFGIGAGTAHQYLFQTGPVNMGFPCEYWMLAGDIAAPQSSRYASLSWNSASAIRGWNISLEGYFRDLSNQMEFQGSFLDYVSPEFRIEDHAVTAEGRNYGVNLCIQKTEGHFTGWVSYAFGRALRHSDIEDYPEWYPSDHERLHEFNLVATYDFGKWDIGLTMVAASGRPFTEPVNFYIAGGKVLTVFGEHNAARLKPYIRADLSANWYFSKTDRLRHGINVSLYNATSRSNEVFRMLKFNRDGELVYGSVRMVPFVFPSLGYFISF